MGSLDNIRTVLTPLKKSEKKWINFYETINRHGPTVTLFDSLFLIKYRDVKFWHILHSSLHLCYHNFGLISLTVWKLCVFDNVAISVIFSSFSIITCDWKGNFWFWWFHRQDRGHINQTEHYWKLKIFFIYLWNSISW